MGLSIKNTGNRTGYSFFAIAALVFIILYPGFTTMVYPDINTQGTVIKKNNIVAEISGKPVTDQDLINRYNLFLVMSKLPDKYIKSITIDSYLDSYLNELLLLQEAEKIGISVGHNEAVAEKKKYMETNNLTEGMLSKVLAKVGLTMEDADRYFETNLIVSLFGNKKYGNVTISDEVAREYYRFNNKLFNGPEKITVSHILICHKESKGCRSDLPRERAREIVGNIQKLVTPDNFSGLAKQFSTDRTGESDGDLGELTRGSFVPAFEEAAFKLAKGGISDVVETDRGYHIIYVTDKTGARSISFEDARSIIKKDLKDGYISSELFKYSDKLLKNADIKRYAIDIKEQELKKQDSIEILKEKVLGYEFKTFRPTGKDICMNSDGQPVILLFSTPSCFHCKWVAETFDDTVMEYVEKGLIEAHHYDLKTQDDLLTTKIEIEIPQEYFEIYKQGSKGYVPYFNFGCRQHRASNGYERQDDLFAEEMEFRKVIDSLIK